MSYAIDHRIDLRRDILMAHVDALMDADQRGDSDGSSLDVQFAMLLNEMQFLVELTRVSFLQALYENVKDDLPVR